ncbi:MAG: HD domain-containing protein [Thaumarchaeota archaeon]|nr:HD domain-containing protein [Nitrososphaerota archaeon]
MPRKSKNDLDQFFRAVGKLKKIDRRGWMVSGGISNPESVADHSFRMAIMAACLSDLKDLDSQKVMRMCLIHDLAESEIGDLSPAEKESEAAHRRQEDRVNRGLFNSLPSKVKRDFLQAWKELLQNETPEAKLVWEIDKFELGLTMKDYIRAGGNSKLLEKFDPSGSLSKDLKDLMVKY